MNLEMIKNLQTSLKALENQLINHQQNRAVVENLEEQIASLKAQNDFNLLQGIKKNLELLSGAFCDEKGLGKLNLMLHNAKVPPKYYDIFYQMLAVNAGATPPPPYCIDCGAHAGLISDIILHCGGRVECFEPNLYLNFFLKRKFEINPLIKIHQKAVSNKSGKTKFLTFQNRILSQGNRIVSSVQDDETSSSYEVELVNLCEFLEQKEERIYLLKLDVEGAEFEILPTLIEKKLYEKIDYIVCETHEYMFKDGVEKLKVIEKELEKRGVKNIFLDWC